MNLSLSLRNGKCLINLSGELEYNTKNIIEVEELMKKDISNCFIEAVENEKRRLFNE